MNRIAHCDEPFPARLVQQEPAGLAIEVKVAISADEHVGSCLSFNFSIWVASAARHEQNKCGTCNASRSSSSSRIRSFSCPAQLAPTTLPPNHGPKPSRIEGENECWGASKKDVFAVAAPRWRCQSTDTIAGHALYRRRAPDPPATPAGTLPPAPPCIRQPSRVRSSTAECQCGQIKLSKTWVSKVPNITSCPRNHKNRTCGEKLR